MDFYQSYAAQHDDEADDEDLKVHVLQDEETGSPDVKPDPPSALGRVYIQERAAVVAL